MNVKEIVSLVLRAVLGGILFYAGLSKAVAPSAEFAGAIEAYHLLPVGVILPLAIGLPWVEMCVGVYLFFGFWTRPFAIVTAVMFGGYSLVLGSSLARGIDIGSCGCFGQGFVFSPRQTIMIDAALLIGSLLLVRLSSPPQPFALDNWIEN